jgi:hypothetical protein
MKENTEEEKQDFIDEMEDGGFTIVLPTKEGARKFVSDGQTTVQVANIVKAQKLQKKLQEKKEVNEDEVAKKRRRQKKELYKSDFYRFQIKEVKKDALKELRKGFELDKIKLVNRKRRKVQ